MEQATYADAVARFGKVRAEGAYQADPATILLIESLRKTRDEIKTLEATEEAMKGKLIATLGDNADTLIDASGNTLLTYKLANGRKTFDSKAFEKDNPDLYQKYVKTSEPQRRFLLK